MLDAAASLVAVPGNLALRRIRLAPTLLKSAKVAEELPRVGGKGPAPFAPLTGNVVPLVALHHIATSTPPS